jgi:hypothetical protein
MVNFFAVCGCCTRTDIVREHLEDTLRICDVSAKGLLYCIVSYYTININQVSCSQCPQSTLQNRLAISISIQTVNYRAVSNNKT